MSVLQLEAIIDQAWECRDRVTPATGGETAAAILETLRLLDEGELRVASPHADGIWRVQQWLKKAVLLWFRLSPNAVQGGGPADPLLGPSVWYDKIRPKFAGWDEASFQRAGFRAVPDGMIRLQGLAFAP